MACIFLNPIFTLAAAYIAGNLCTKNGNSSFFKLKIHGLWSRAASNREQPRMGCLWYFFSKVCLLFNAFKKNLATPLLFGGKEFSSLFSKNKVFVENKHLKIRILLWQAKQSWSFIHCDFHYEINWLFNNHFNVT